MALTKSTTVLGLTVPNAYYNIQGVTITKVGSGVYDVTLLVNEYTDSTKANHIQQTGYTFNNVAEADLNYAYYYGQLKTLEEFTTATDI